MKKLVIIVAIGIAGWYWSGGSIPFLPSAGAYDEAGDPAVWLFTVDGCGKPCDSARNQLKRRKVAFEEKRIDPDNKDDEDVKFWQRNARNAFPLIASGAEVSVGQGASGVATVLALNFGDKYLTRNEKILFKKHFYEDGSPKIVMYGADWCQICAKLRTEFKDNNVDFIEIDVDRHAAREKIVKAMEIYGYPATWVGYTRVNGSTLKAVNKVLRSY
jgi:glutaredoxin